MPPNNYSALEAGMIVAYLRGIAAGDNVTVTAGDLARGKALFEGKGKCATCHNPESRTAPSLADVGVLRRPLELEQSILDPSAELHPDYRYVRAVTKSGTVVTGRLLNQSTFSVQIMDSAQNLRGFNKADLREFVDQPDVRDAVVSRHARFTGSGRSRHVSHDTARPPMTKRVFVLALVIVASASLGAAGVVRSAPPLAVGASELADVLGQPSGASPLAAHAGHADQRQEPRACVGVSGAVAGEVRSDADCARRRALHRPASQ